MDDCRRSSARALLFSVVLTVLGVGAPTTRAQDLKPIMSINDGKCFGLVEIHLPMDKKYQNPFDPEEVALQGHFRDANGSDFVVDGFANQNYTMTHGEKDAWDHLTPDGPQVWTVRFSPATPGKYSWWVTRKDSGGEATSAKSEFSITNDASAKGFIRVAANHTNFEYGDGSSNYPIGMDIAWVTKGGMYDFERWFHTFAENGGNQVRVFMGLVGYPLERIKVPPGGLFDNVPATKLSYVSAAVFPDLNERTQLGQSDPGGGLGRIDLANAWRYDSMLGLARQDGIHVQLCLNAASEFTVGGFPWNPYNKANGGMLEKPADFFTNTEAKAYEKRRLRYIVARYGWSAQVLSWELFNEVDDFSHSTPYPAAESAAWHQEMARYVNQLDVHHHMVTTSFAFEPHADIFSLPEIDFTQDHTYNVEDNPPIVTDLNAMRVAQYGKPHIFGEFGLEFLQRKWDGGHYTDPTGVQLETAYWASLASPGAGTVWPWYWDNYIEPLKLFPLTKPVAEFAADVAWNKLKWTPLETPKVTYVQTQPTSTFQTLRVTPIFWNGLKDAAKQPETFRVGNDGTFDPPMEKLGWVLSPPNKNHVADPTTFDVNYPQAGEFEVQVSVVGKHGANLGISLDGQSAFSKDFPGAASKGPFLFQYAASYPIDVPAGHHTIAVVNTGSESVAVHYIWTNYLSPEVSRLRFCGMHGDDTMAILYLYNQDYTWWQIDHGEVPKPVPASRLTVPGLRAGQYEVEIWSPSEGRMLNRTTVAGGSDGLPISLPEVTNDVAVKIRLASSH